MSVRVECELGLPLALGVRNLGAGALDAWRAGSASATEACTAIALARDARAALAFLAAQPAEGEDTANVLAWCQGVCVAAGDLDVAHTLVVDHGVSASWAIELAERLYACSAPELHGPIQNVIAALQRSREGGAR